MLCRLLWRMTMLNLSAPEGCWHKLTSAPALLCGAGNEAE